MQDSERTRWTNEVRSFAGVAWNRQADREVGAKSNLYDISSTLAGVGKLLPCSGIIAADNDDDFTFSGTVRVALCKDVVLCSTPRNIQSRV